MRFGRDEKGQGMTEYIILVALIALIAIGAVKYFGGQTKEGFQQAGDQIKGVNQDAASESVGRLND